MTIVVTGGGSGGHITPVLAVASALKQLDPTLRIVYIGQTGDSLLDIAADSPAIDEVRTIRAGKFRRYHGEGWKQLLDLPTQLRNLRDIFYILIGCWQSYRLLGQYKPAVIFTRGGFVSVPVAFAAGRRGIRYFTHDSDSTPSLANRLIAKRAYLHAVALPAELYPYPAAKTRQVGIPLSPECRPVTTVMQRHYRQELGLPPAGPVLLVTGGGNGAVALNKALTANAAYLLGRYPALTIIHLAGRGLEATTLQDYQAVLPAGQLPQIRVLGFSTDFYKFSGAADVIVARGGATNLAEFSLQGKACIIVPPKQLIWAIRNTEALAQSQAVVYLTDDQIEQEQRLGRAVAELLDDPGKRQTLADTLQAFAKPDAAQSIAELLLEAAA